MGVLQLHSAGHLETVQLLLKRRADPRATNRKGEAPLAMARDDAIREAVSAALAAPPPSAAAKQVRTVGQVIGLLQLLSMQAFFTLALFAHVSY